MWPRLNKSPKKTSKREIKVQREQEEIKIQMKKGSRSPKRKVK